MGNLMQLYVGGTGSTIGQVQLMGDEPFEIKYQNSDIRDITKRSSNRTRTFTVLANDENNQLFNHIFNIGSDSTYDPSKKVPSYLLVDYQLVMQGSLQLTDIRLQDSIPLSYDLVLYGETIDMVKTLGDKYLTDLDWSELDHKYTTNSIMHSWSSNTAQLGYYYGLQDFGYDLSVNELNSGILSIIAFNGSTTNASVNTLSDTTQTWNTNELAGLTIIITEGAGNGQSRNITANTLNSLTVNPAWTTIPDINSKYQITRLDYTNPYSSNGNGLSPLIFKPALSNTYMFKKIINNIGFSIENDFIDREVFAETVTGFNGDEEDTVPNDYINSISFRAGMSALTELEGCTFNDVTHLNNFDNGGLYDVGTQRYTANAVSSQDFVANVRFQYNNVAPYPDICTFRFYRSTYSGGTTPFSTVNYPLGVVNTSIYELNAISAKCDNPNSTVGLYPIQSGESVWVGISLTQGAVFPGPVLHVATCFQAGSYFYNRVSPKLVANGDLFYNQFVPRKIKQIDIIQSFIKRFNLLVVPNKTNPKNISFIPRDEYYANGQVKIWTQKVDHNYKTEVTVISEQQNKQIIFTDKADTDYYNTYYTEDTNRIYGDYIKEIDNEWLEQNSKQTISTIYSPSPLDTIYGTVDVVVSKIGKLENSGAFGKTSSNIRFFRKNPYLMPTVSTIKLDGGPIMNAYPYMGHLDHPFESTIDYNFGTIEYAFFSTPGFFNLQNITQNNMVNSYWKQYLDDISDKNSKIIKCRIHLTPADIAQFNYNDSIYIEGLSSEGGNYYIVNSITYIPTSDESSVVELIKINRPATQILGNTDLFKRGNPLRRSSIVLGDGRVNSKNSFVAGTNTYLGEFSEGSFIIGDNNFIGQSSPNNFVSGQGNIVGNRTTNSYVVGNNNTIGSLDTTDTTGTTASTMVYLSGVTLLGVNNYTATASDTLYVPNIQLTTTGGTINGVTINNIIAGSTYWTAGTGTDSIILNNNTGNIAQGTNSFVAGQFNQTIEVTALNGNAILGGGSNIIAG